MRDVVLVSTVRTAVGKSGRGALATTRPDDLAATAIEGALARLPQLDRNEIEDVILGCAMPEAEQGMNVARIAALRAGLPVGSSAMTVNRFCASGLQSIAMAAERIRGGGAEVIIAGGTESMSMVPMGGNKVSANPWLIDHYADSYLSMGLTAERVAQRYGIGREEADAFALSSHEKALFAIEAGRFTAEIVARNRDVFHQRSGKIKLAQKSFTIDEGPRADTSLSALAALKPAFHAKGTVTAGNSPQTLRWSRRRRSHVRRQTSALGIRPLARFVAFATAGCLPEEMGVGPVYAVPKALKLAGLTLDQIDLIELNEAFAAQSLAVIQQLHLDPAKVNVNGGAIALGHPLGMYWSQADAATLLHSLQVEN